MVLGVLQTSNGARLASLDIDEKEGINTNLRNAKSRIDFITPLSISSSTARGSRMVAAYTSIPQNSNQSVTSDKVQKFSLKHMLAIVGSLTAFAVATLSAGSNFVKHLLPHKTYSLHSGRTFTWPALSLSHAQLSNAVVVGLVIVGISSFALWMPVDQPDIAQNPPAAMGANTSNTTQNNPIPTTNNSGNTASSSSWTSPTIQTQWLPVQSTPNNSFAQSEELLPSQQVETTTTPVVDPVTEIIDEPIIGTDPPIETPEIPIFPEVIIPVNGTLENTLNIVTEISGSF